ncbi:MAG: zinc-dependent alcohol dehydrogenase family protein [Spirochaetaceae bacterium]|jgi:2-desacetyl-2-hydroxyethyl bacteriochlorophyllide A dehydrogenase|nr:zinc-dependent alcohol dehydrogenase family protein [Spirochaetaceae bacterium]
MRAFVIEKPLEASVTEMEKPVPGDDEIVLEVKAVGLCGTDMHIYKGEYFGTYPRIPGHEFSGVVVETGKKVRNFSVGQRVAADPNIFCESCVECQHNNQNFCLDFEAVGVSRHGAFAAYTAVPERCVFDTTGLGFTESALIEPLSCVVFGHQRIGSRLAERVLVVGAGPIGLMHTQMAKINGAASVTVVDLQEEKLELAKRLGADAVYDSAGFERAALTNHFELVIDCTGIPTVIENSVKYIKNGGTMLLFGVSPDNSAITINPYEIFKRQLTLTSSFALKKTFGLARELILQKRVAVLPLVDSRLPLEEAPSFFKKQLEGNRGMKAVFYPNGDAE